MQQNLARSAFTHQTFSVTAEWPEDDIADVLILLFLQPPALGCT